MHAATEQLMGHMVSIVNDYVGKGYSMTVRQVYYQLVAKNILPNTPASYTRTSKILNTARREGHIAWESIVDRVRVPVMPRQFESMHHFVNEIKRSYRRHRWEDQRHYVEVMVEKEALAGILVPITQKYHVSLLVNKGYASASAMHDVASRMAYEAGIRQKECHILYLGDHDPSGMDMVRDIQDRLVGFGAPSHVSRIALTFDQIEQYRPPPNPAKITDPRSKQYRQEYGNGSWELDALDPEVLAEILEINIRKYLDVVIWSKIRTEIDNIF